MNNYKFSKSPKYLVDSLKLERFVKTIVFEMDLDSFKTKESIKNADIDGVVSALDDFLKRNNLRTNPNKVCIEINLHVHQKNAPSIQNIPKAYLDLIQKLDPRNDNVPRKERSLISDDKNISVLKVNYLRSENKTNKLEIKLIPFSVVRRAINTLFRLERGYYDSIIQGYRVCDKKEDDCKITVNNSIIEDEFWELYKKENEGKLDQLDQFWYTYCKWFLQNDFYGHVGDESYFPINLFFDRIRHYGYKDLLVEIEERNLLLGTLPFNSDKLPSISQIESFHFQIKLPENPQESGESKMFKDEVKSQIDRIIQRDPYLKPTFVPLSLLIVVLPGEKDLDVDNLARKYIIPIIENALQPPSDHLSKIKDDNFRYELTMFAKDRNIPVNIEFDKFFPNDSLASYECIKLERSEEGEGGFVYVGIYSSISHIGFVERLFNRIEDFEFD